jgi:hypothetical protein
MTKYRDRLPENRFIKVMKFGMCLLMLMSGSVLCGFKGNYFDAASGCFALFKPLSIDDAYRMKHH